MRYETFYVFRMNKNHYENAPIQIYCKLYHKKKKKKKKKKRKKEENFQIKNSDFFIFQLKT